MACFPVGRGAIQFHRRAARNVGGESRQYNLTPYSLNLNPRENADLEIRRALRIYTRTRNDSSLLAHASFHLQLRRNAVW